MSMTLKDGSHVHEIFASAFKQRVNGLVLGNEPIALRLNQQDTEHKTLYSDYAFACDLVGFLKSLDNEIMAHGIAIVVATDYRTDSHETTVFVVCDD